MKFIEEYQVNDKITIFLNEISSYISVKDYRFKRIKVYNESHIYDREHQSLVSFDGSEIYKGEISYEKANAKSNFDVICKKIKQWVSHGYDPKLLTIYLRLPLLKRLAYIDPIARNILKEELRELFKQGEPLTCLFIFENKYLDFLVEDEYNELFDNSFNLNVYLDKTKNLKIKHMEKVIVNLIENLFYTELYKKKFKLILEVIRIPKLLDPDLGLQNLFLIYLTGDGSVVEANFLELLNHLKIVLQSNPVFRTFKEMVSITTKLASGTDLLRDNFILMIEIIESLSSEDKAEAFFTLMDSIKRTDPTLIENYYSHIEGIFLILINDIIRGRSFVDTPEISSLHPNLDEFKKRIPFKSSQIYRAYVRDDESYLFNEFKRVDEDLFFDDAGSEMELDGENLLSEFITSLSRGYEIHVHMSTNWQMEIHKLRRGFFYEQDYIVLYPKDFSDLMIPYNKSKVLRDKGLNQEKIDNRTYHRDLLKAIKGTKLMEDNQYKVESICIELLTEIEKFLEEKDCNINMFRELVSAIKGTDLMDTFSSRIELIFSSFLTKVETMSDGRNKYNVSDLVLLIKGTDMMDTYSSRTTPLISNYLTWIESLPDIQDKTGYFSHLVSAVKGTDMMDTFSSRIEPIFSSFLTAVETKPDGRPSISYLVAIINGTELMDTFSSRIEPLFSNYLTWMENLPFGPDKRSKFSYLIYAIKGTNLLDTFSSRIETLKKMVNM